MLLHIYIFFVVFAGRSPVPTTFSCLMNHSHTLPGMLHGRSGDADCGKGISVLNRVHMWIANALMILQLMKQKQIFRDCGPLLSPFYYLRGGGGGGGSPWFFVKLDFEIAVDQQTRARDRTFEGVPDSGWPPVPAGQPRPYLVNLWPNFAKWP